MNRSELHRLYTQLEKATREKALANKLYEELVQEFMNEIMQHYPLERNEP